MTGTTTTAVLAGISVAALTVLAACGDDASGAGGSGGGDGLSITRPADGARVSSTFEVAWDSDVELGEPDTGRDHVHVFVDGHSEDYTVVGGNEFTIEDLAPGDHTVDVTLQHADHSSAGADDEISVTVGGGAEPTSPSETTDEPSDPGPGYGY